MSNQRLAEIVGGSNVLESKNSLGAYLPDSNFAPQLMPKCIVKPSNTNEVQEIVRWANETLTPLIPLSSGSPHIHGGTTPSVKDSVIVDLSRMKRIIRVDHKNRVAMVEPGVTFGELQTELDKVGLSAYLPLNPRVSKSVIGSILEREPTTYPHHHWDATDPMLCAEVIFGTGDKMRTGEAAGPDKTEEQWEIGKAQMCPFGLSQMNENRLISGAQGSIGIVTWATLKCSFKSKFSQAFLTPSKSLEPLIDLSYQLLRIRLGDRLFILNNLNVACLLGRNPLEIENLRDILPPWVLFTSFEGYGILPEEKVSYQESDFKDMAKVYNLEPMIATSTGVTAEDLSDVLSQPSADPYWKLRLKGGCQDIFFLTTLDKTPTFVTAMSDLAKSQRYPTGNIGIYIQPIVQGTSCHCEFNLYYEPIPTEIKKVKWLVEKGTRKLAEAGAFFSRPYGSWKDFAYGNVEDTIAMQKGVKQIFDPRGILNPGKLCF